MPASFLRWKIIGHEITVSSCIRGGLEWTLGRMSSLREYKESSTGMGCPKKWRSCIQEMRRWSIKRYGLVMRFSRSGWWLDLMTVKIFSNLDDSVTLWFCELLQAVQLQMPDMNLTQGIQNYLLPKRKKKVFATHAQISQKLRLKIDLL